MKTDKQTNIFPEEYAEPKQLNINVLFTELTVQLWQTITDALTVYKRVLWLKKRQRTRLSLLELSDEQLKDIGISRYEANREGNKHFWE